MTDDMRATMTEIAERLERKLEEVVAAYGVRHEGEYIRVYRFEDAPENLRKLSQNGGDEDWLAVVPPDYEERHWIPWLESGTPFGISSVERHELFDGTAVYIGSHS